MKLSKRLQTIADMVDIGSNVYDIGCDHAYLDIYLANLGFKCTAIDSRDVVVQNAKKNVIESGLEKQIDVILNDGLKNIKIETNDVVILAGLGTKSILEIIDDQFIENLIVQSNDDLYLLRKTLNQRNYYITDEKIVFENNKYYIIIKFKLGKVRYDDYELMLGPKLLKNKNEIFRQYLNDKLNHFEETFKKIPERYSNKCIEIKTIIDNIKMALK